MKIYLGHNDYSIESDFSIEEIERLRAAAPDSLKLKDADGKVVFAISAVEDMESAGMNKNGITFAATSFLTGNAILYCPIDFGKALPNEVEAGITVDLIKRVIARAVGCRLDYGRLIEAQMHAALERLSEQEEAVIAEIAEPFGDQAAVTTVETAVVE